MVALFILPAGVFAFETTALDGVEVAADRLMVTVDPLTPRAAVVAAMEAKGLAVVRVSTRFGAALRPREWAAKAIDPESQARFVLVEFDSGRNLATLLDEVSTLPGVTGAYPDQILRPSFIPNDPLYGKYQEYLQQMNIEKAWDRTRGKGVIVAVVDTGYLLDGLSDGAVNLLDGYDFADNDLDPTDYQGHGTFVANIIAHHTNNGLGAAGAAPEVSILPCKVFRDNAGGAYESDIVVAIDWAVTQGAHVINMSLGGDGYSGVSNASTHDAVDAGTVLLAASGNDGRALVSYPAGYDAVIAVGSSNTHPPNAQPYRSDFSNYGDDIELMAPGNGILGETLGENGVDFYISSGTSMASPHASAAAALVIAAMEKDYTVARVREVLHETALGTDGDWDFELGYGEINVYGAVEAAAGSNPNQPPKAAIIATPRTGAAPLTVDFTAAASDPDGDPLSLLWSFSTGETFNHHAFSFTFKEPGSYVVFLSVSDSANEGAAADITIVVSEGDEGEVEEGDDDSGCGGNTVDTGGFGGWLLVFLPFAAYLSFTRRRMLAAGKAKTF